MFASKVLWALLLAGTVVGAALPWADKGEKKKGEGEGE